MEKHVECCPESNYRLTMEEKASEASVRLRFAHRKGSFWMKLILVVAVIFIVWFFFIRPTAVELTPAEQTQLLDLARRQLAASVVGGSIDAHSLDLSDGVLRKASAFVSLTVNGVLRGCMIDRFEPHEPLYSNVLRNVELAVLSDQRFATIEEDEIENVRIKISVVHNIETLRFSNPDELLTKLAPSVDGIILRIDEEIATYLPSVWATFPDPNEFLSRLCIKAGWEVDRWRTEPYPMIQTYRVYEFGGPE